MDMSAHLDTLIGLFDRLEIPVRQEPLGGQGGGLCTLRGQRVFFLDIDAHPATRADALLAALATIPEVENLYLPPAIREIIQASRGR